MSHSVHMFPGDPLVDYHQHRYGTGAIEVLEFPFLTASAVMLSAPVESGRPLIRFPSTIQSSDVISTSSEWDGLSYAFLQPYRPVMLSAYVVIGTASRTLSFNHTVQ